MAGPGGGEESERWARSLAGGLRGGIYKHKTWQQAKSAMRNTQAKLLGNGSRGTEYFLRILRGCHILDML